ncbi:hypothetical protein K503DRAFT_771315 [Rhizopogon vinicolor AM-OR11-026]|uniref:F-box domain-containing protein n=1 Tax=Rhizopogon vinicolor AM-OR11-026 TaxID=1314800 RepID=A0A1B7MYD0_9AGAM|nr:hypothetical protein K503DRAFT_771315 [Rhizopogon vinicolor AM-OR11-026]
MKRESELSTHVLHHKDILIVVLERLPLLDLIQFGRTCSDLRSAMGYVVRQRFRSIMVVFVRDFLPAFVQVLDRSGGVITGSCAIKPYQSHCRSPPQMYDKLVFPKTNNDEAHNYHYSFRRRAVRTKVPMSHI